MIKKMPHTEPDNTHGRGILSYRVKLRISLTHGDMMVDKANKTASM